MPLTAQDFLKGVDISGINPVTGTDLNDLLELAAPVLDSATEGKGIVVWTVDSALNTPVVPNAAGITKWQRYLWLRIPFAGATNKKPSLYSWNSDTASVATYLRWLRVDTDLSAIQAQIDTIVANVATTLAIANSASTTASVANVTAANASVNAAAANASASGAAANASTALANAAAAQLVADAAQASADSAVISAASAQANASSAVIIANQALGSVSPYLESAEFSLVSDASLISFAHALTRKPRYIRPVLVCKVDDLGYVVGDEVDWSSVSSYQTMNDGYPLQIKGVLFSSATTIGIRVLDQTGSLAIDQHNGWYIPNKATAALSALPTLVNWKLKFYYAA